VRGEAIATTIDTARSVTPGKKKVFKGQTHYRHQLDAKARTPKRYDKAIYTTTQPPAPTPKLSVLMGIEGSGTRIDPGSLGSEIRKSCEAKKSMNPGRF
jgi:hypothetical protein